MPDSGILHLNDGEKILGIIRRSFISELLKIVFASLWILVPFFFFFPLIHLGIFGFALFVILAGSGVIYAFKIWMILSYTMLIVTNQRIIDIVHHGLFEREIQEIKLSSVRAVRVLKRNIIQKLINIGTVRIKTQRLDKFDLEIEGVRKPQIVRQFVEEVKQLHNTP